VQGLGAALTAMAMLAPRDVLKFFDPSSISGGLMWGAAALSGCAVDESASGSNPQPSAAPAAAGSPPDSTGFSGTAGAPMSVAGTGGGAAGGAGAPANAGSAGSGGAGGGAGGAANVGSFSDGVFTHVDLKGHCLDHGVPTKDGKSVVVTPGEAYDVTAIGAEIGHHCGSDQGRFVYVELDGDFDVSAQLAHMSNGGAVTDGRGRPTPTKAGIMARVGLEPTALFIAMHAAEPIAEFPDAWSFDRRGEPNGNLATGGFDYGFINNGSALFKRQLPNIYVRLKRVGNTFYGFASVDGVNWSPSSKASYTADYPSKLFVGLSQMSAPENERDSVESVTHFRMLRGFPPHSAATD
jgi:hypothetical protein